MYAIKHIFLCDIILRYVTFDNKDDILIFLFFIDNATKTDHLQINFLISSLAVRFIQFKKRKIAKLQNSCFSNS
uniref:Uncharacterized protein n=1 Tax=Onchocerca volvulus TaxID=6282 RepID=A0A8R1TQ15_ONCVO